MMHLFKRAAPLFGRRRSRQVAYDFAMHPLFAEYERWQGPVNAGYDVSFLGQVTNVSFVWPRPEYATEGRYQCPPYPALSEESFEWLALLTAVKEARTRFVMIEGGAGYGRWIVGAACAIRRMRPGLPFALMGIEAEPHHFEWMKQHFRDNGLDPDTHRLIFGAIDAQDGAVTFDFSGDPAATYGHAIIKDGDARAALNAQTVQSYSIGALLAEFERIDLMDFDIQGAELEAIPAGIAAMDRKVCRTYVATHRPEIDVALAECFLEHGWTNIYKFDCWKTQETPYGPVTFDDGVQFWLNPRLV